MPNSRFSNLIYKIIGKPEVIQDEYSKILNNALEEADLFTDPNHFAEMEVGHEILNRIENSDDAIKALNALLDDGRFKIIILNSELRPIYNNHNARGLLERLVSTTDDQKLNDELLSAIQSTLVCLETQESLRHEKLILLDYLDQNEEQIYLKTVVNQNNNTKNESRFQLLLALDESKRSPLNQQLLDKYQFTLKEQQILIGLIHGNTVKEIAANEFISENTVKTHLKSLYRKTDTKSQAKIVSLVLSHESQILDSYFTDEANLTNLESNNVEDKSVTLASGHVLFYRDYGKSDGDILIVFHNAYSSRLMVPKNYLEICERTNRRIIIIDRPGYGKTDFTNGHPAKWNHMLNEFLYLLKIDSYDILAAVLSCPLAIEFAAQADHRLKRLILSSPLLINQESDGKHLLGILEPSQRIVKGSHRFAKQAYELWLKSVTLNLSAHYRKMIINGVGSAEREQFEREGTIDLIVETFREATSQSLKGISHELIHCLAPLNIDLNKITIPVDLWWGTEDRRCTRTGVEQLAKKFPNSNLHIKLYSLPQYLAPQLTLPF